MINKSTIMPKAKGLSPALMEDPIASGKSPAIADEIFWTKSSSILIKMTPKHAPGIEPSPPTIIIPKYQIDSWSVKQSTFTAPIQRTHKDPAKPA